MLIDYNIIKCSSCAHLTGNTCNKATSPINGIEIQFQEDFGCILHSLIDAVEKIKPGTSGDCVVI